MVADKIATYFQNWLGRRGKNRYLIIESLGKKIQVALADINFGEKQIKVLRYYIVEKIQQVRRTPFLNTLILALNSEEATTVESVIHLKRVQPQAIITESELDDLAFRALWEFLNLYRSWAAKKMYVTDLNLVLVGIEAKDIWLGPHKVFNPLGFKGENFSLKLKGTFIPQFLAPTIKNFKSWTKNLVIVESSNILTSALDQRFHLVVHSTDEQTIVFSLSKNELVYFKQFSWGKNNLIAILRKLLLIDEETAKIIFDRYQNNQVSDTFKKLINKLMLQELNIFKGKFNLLLKNYKELNKAAPAFDFRFAFPDFFPWPKYFQGKLFDFNDWLKKQGFKVYFPGQEGSSLSGIQSSLLALAVHSYLSPSYKILNQFLRRRAKWLISTL